MISISKIVNSQRSCVVLSVCAIAAGLISVGGFHAVIVITIISAGLAGLAAVCYGLSRLIIGPFAKDADFHIKVMPGLVALVFSAFPSIFWGMAFSGGHEKNGVVTIGFINSGHTAGGILCVASTCLGALCFARKYMWEDRTSRIVGFGAAFVILSMGITILSLLSMNVGVHTG